MRQKITDTRQTRRGGLRYLAVARAAHEHHFGRKREPSFCDAGLVKASWMGEQGLVSCLSRFSPKDPVAIQEALRTQSGPSEELASRYEPVVESAAVSPNELSTSRS